jgi:hypothetical protein
MQTLLCAARLLLSCCQLGVTQQERQKLCWDLETHLARF